MNELLLVEKLRQRNGRGRGLILGIGDDCAIFRPSPGEDLVLKSDQLIEGIHFLPSMKPAAIGERALARALSDIASMGATPRLCLVSLALPKSKSDRWIDGFFRGLLRLAHRVKTPLAGGDLAHDDKVHCDVIVCGSVPRGKALRRDGARPGDLLYVSGRLGKPWDRPIEARLALGKSLLGRATSCMDLSDGIALDLYRLCQASGVSAELDHVPIFRGATLERALHGGEDYELLFTLPPEGKAPRGTTRVGVIVKGKPGQVRFRGELLPPRGYDHFA